MSDRPRRIVLGVTGSVAAAKAQSIALALQHCGFEVRACLSPAAKRIIGLTSLEAVLKHPVYADLWLPAGGFGETHIEWGEWADAMLIAPASASCIGSLWAGTFDTPVTLVAGTIPLDRLFLAPAMAQALWERPPVRRNVAELEQWGVRFLGPVEGRVASGGLGQRLMRPREIAERVSGQVTPRH